MVLINDKKFACGTCIKGHRVSGCTHTDRPLFEVKKKGRPATQCQYCREKRKGSGAAVHTKCQCGDPKAPAMLMPSEVNDAIPGHATSPSETPTPPVTQISNDNTETRKGMPGSTPTFPNGLRDVHDMAAAADVLSTLGGEESQRVAERSVANLLNPCTCRSNGICKCCQPKRERVDSSPTPGSSFAQNRGKSGHAQITDSVIEMFQAKATTSTAPPESEASCSSSSSTPSAPPLAISTALHPSWPSSTMPFPSLLSPDNMRHPAHTSPHVHKTKLYSPYSASGHASPRHSRRPSGAPVTLKQAGWASSSTATIRPPPPKIRPLADMNTLLGAVFKDDGSVASEIPRSALGLPGIKTFDAMAESGGVKVEPMDMEVDEPVAFPTSEDVVIGACTCGEDCECAGCATHGNPASDAPHTHDGTCGDGCKSNFNCADHLSLPSGITSIDHLLSIAAANVPQPVRMRLVELDGHNTRVLPPAVLVSEDAARSHGVISLKPLECCNGRCQCPPGNCTCEEECCGCCIRCSCEEDGDQHMDADREEAPASCCGGTQPTLQQEHLISPTHLTPPSLSPGVPSFLSGQSGPSGLGSTASLTPPRPASSSGRSRASSISRQPSPGPSVQLGTSVRRASSTSQKYPNRDGSVSSVGRRATITSQNSSGSASRHTSLGTGKSASKALALHATPNHPHSHAQPRSILPKPPSQQTVGGQTPRLAPPRHSDTGNAARVPSPAGRTNSSGSSRAASPSRMVRQGIPQIQTTDTSTELGPFNLDLSTVTDDTDIMSYIGGLPESMDFTQMYISGSSVNGTGQDQVAATAAENQPQDATTLKMPDIPVDFEGLLAQLLGQQQPTLPSSQPVNADFGDHPYAQFLAQLQPQPSPQTQGGGTSAAGDVESDADPSKSLFESFGFASNQPPLDDRQLSAFAPSVGMNSSIGYGHNQTDSYDLMMWTDERVSQFVSQMAARSTPSTATTAGTVASRPPPPPAAVPASVNPDLIDLSKPLDGSALERIMKALDEQNRRSETVLQAPAPAPAPTQLQIPPRTHLPSRQASPLSSLPHTLAQQLDLSVTARQPYPASIHSTSSGNTSFESSNPEDLFDQFVYDPPPERNDPIGGMAQAELASDARNGVAGSNLDVVDSPWVQHQLREWQM